MLRPAFNRFLIGLVGSFLVSNVAVGQQLASPALSPHVRGAIAWLPPDSDTLQVAQEFTVRDPQQSKSQVGPLRDFRYSAQLSVLEGLFEPQHAKYLVPLAGRKVLAAVRGARNAEVVSNFGSLRAEGCSIILFKDDLGTAAKEWTDLVRQGAHRTRKYNGYEVFVLGSTIVMEGRVKLKPWQGTFMVLLTTKCLLCASSDKYLEYVLDHVESPPAVRAFPESLPEWQHLDTAAAGWMLRHVHASSKQSIIGVTMTTTKDRCRVVYLPLEKATHDPKRFVLNRWLGKDPIVELATPYDFKRSEDGTISVTSGLEAFDLENSLFLRRLFSLSGET